MIAVIPIFLQSNDQLWRTPEGNELILKTFRSVLNARQIENLMVFTNDDFVASMAKSLGIDANMIEDIESQESELLPIGTSSSLSYLHEVLNIDFDSLMILGFRNPLLTPELIDQASAKFKHSKAPALISVKTSIDHPCQLNAYYKIADIGFIHLFDNEKDIAPYLQALEDHITPKQSPNQRNPRNLSNQRLNQRSPNQRNLCNPTNLRLNQHSPNQRNQCNPSNLRLNQRYRLTKPFHFDWESRGIHDKGKSGLYFRRYDDFHIKYIPIEEPPDRTSSEISSPLWIYDTGKTARVLFDLNSCPSYEEPIKTDPNLIMIGAAFSDGHISCLLTENDETSKYLLVLNSEDLQSRSCIVKAVPVSRSGPVENRTIEVETDDFSIAIPFQFEEKDACGIIYFLLRLPHDDTYDLQEPFVPNTRLWDKDNGSGKTVNTQTGKEIMGRQDFPEVLEPDGTFFIMNKDLISSFDKEVLNGNADSFIIEENASIQIKSELDLLKYKAITKATDSR